MTPVAAATETHLLHATPLPSVARGVPDATLERVARSLRGARARTGMSQQQVVALLMRRGVAISLVKLRRVERTGMLDLACASHLADAYGTTTDCLSGRRPGRVQVAA
jgi:hypothetical protein